MGFIQLKEANCKNCYKCIRECPVKAISFQNEQAQVIDKECVLCGKCILACPQNAKQVVSDLDHVKRMLEGPNPVYVSLAPSFASYFHGSDMNSMAEALKKLGFAQAEETAIGAAKVSGEYEKLLADGKMRNIITTACPTVVLLVEKYYPELISQLAPVVSPMTAHAISLRKVYGSHNKVIFIGPCISKKQEADDILSGGAVDMAITFDELKMWLEEENIPLSPADGADGANGTDGTVRGIHNSAARFYPMPGGILRTIPADRFNRYKSVSVDGMERCMEILDSIRNGEVSDYFIEMNACVGACLGGPCMRSAGIGFIKARDDASGNARKSCGGAAYETDRVEAGLHRSFLDRSVSLPMPSEGEIRKILSSIGKTRPEQELNCGGCGYATCRDKAVAVYQGKADPKMCLPFVRERAESISNLVIDYTPNAIIVLDSGLRVQEANPAALSLFGPHKNDILGRPIEELLPCPYYEEVLNEGMIIQNRKITYESLDLTVEQSIIYIREQQLMFIILKNITSEEKQQQSLQKVREETLTVAQRVIDKQMRVAQEIASLLGETTAETKTALTKLKKSITSD